MQVKIVQHNNGGPAGKLADAELHFDDGPLAGLKLVGITVWEGRDGQAQVTLPTRHYTVDGERRRYILLRPASDASTTDLSPSRDHGRVRAHAAAVTRPTRPADAGTRVQRQVPVPPAG